MRRYSRPVGLVVLGVVVGLVTSWVQWSMLYTALPGPPAPVPEDPRPLAVAEEQLKVSKAILQAIPQNIDYSNQLDDLHWLAEEQLDVAKEQLEVAKSQLVATRLTNSIVTEWLSGIHRLNELTASRLNDQSALLQKLVTAVEVLANRPPETIVVPAPEIPPIVIPPITIPPITVPPCACNRSSSESEDKACSHRVSESVPRVHYPSRRVRCR